MPMHLFTACDICGACIASPAITNPVSVAFVESAIEIGYGKRISCPKCNGNTATDTSANKRATEIARKHLSTVPANA